MEDKIFIALVASGCSIIIAIISLITSVLINRSTNRTLLSIESIKMQEQLLSEKRAIRQKNIMDYFGSLKEALISLQTMKDNVLVILDSIEGSLTRQSAINLIENGIEIIFGTYKNNIDVFEERGIKDKFHRAKGIALSIKGIIINPNLDSSDIYHLDYKSRQELTQLRNEL